MFEIFQVICWYVYVTFCVTFHMFANGEANSKGLSIGVSREFSKGFIYFQINNFNLIWLAKEFLKALLIIKYNFY